MKHPNPKRIPAADSARKRRTFRRLLCRCAFVVLLPCLGGGISCIAPSPSLRAAHQAQRWQQAAWRLKTQPSHQFTDALASLPTEGRARLLTLWRTPTDGRINQRVRLIGRAFLWAAAHYLDATRLALEEGNLDRAAQFCEAAKQCLYEAATHLPSWERFNTLLWGRQVAALQRRLNERFYARTHLLALCVKVKAQAAFLPKARQTSPREDLE